MPTETVRTALSSHWFDRYARFGYIAKGVSWGIVGLIAMRLALGGGHEQADFSGALGELEGQPLDVVMLGVLAAGLLGYAGWRIVQGAMDVEGEGGGPRGWVKRSAYIFVGLWYGVFGVYAAGILGGWSTEEDEVRDLTAMALGWPGGEWLVGTVGVLVVGSGLLEFYVAFTGKFEVEIGDSDRGRFERVCVLCTGWFGHTARGVLYTAAGVFAVRAAVEFDPDEARGIAATFRELLTQPHGTWIVGAVAAGFFAFGIYCVLLALHRHIPNEGIMRGRNREGEAEPPHERDEPEEPEELDEREEPRQREERYGRDERRAG